MSDAAEFGYPGLAPTLQPTGAVSGLQQMPGYSHSPIYNKVNGILQQQQHQSYSDLTREVNILQQQQQSYSELARQVAMLPPPCYSDSAAAVYLPLGLQSGLPSLSGLGLAGAQQMLYQGHPGSVPLLPYNVSGLSHVSHVSHLPQVYLQPASNNRLQSNKIFSSLNSGGDKTEYFDSLNRTNSNKRKIVGEEIGGKTETKKAKIETRALKAKRPGFTDERYNETSYFFENGLRKVVPYYFTFTTFTKGRWVGETILTVFSREFRAQPRHEYERCINAGTLTVNFEKVPVDYKLKHNDLLANIVHRHEVPVADSRIQVIRMTEDLVVVDKPASIPVHPCGRYRHNTVVFILAKEQGLKNLRTIHRLDRLTSGLLMFGRNPAKAREMETQIRTRQVRKEYVARVEGEFPGGLVQCRESIEVISYKIGVCRVAGPGAGKECHTEFQRLSFNGAQSVVLCRPYTGRMHQIRVHLQYLGHPVVNDPLYNHPVFGPEKGRGGNIGKTEAELVSALIEIHNSDNWIGDDTETSPAEMTRLDQDLMALSAKREMEKALVVQEKSEESHESHEEETEGGKVKGDANCYECKVRYRDPTPKDLVMYLHALRYQGTGWSYETELPPWAEASWTDQE